MAPIFLGKRVHEKILTIFIVNAHKKYSFSDLVKLTGAGPTNVKRSLDELKNRGIFEQQQEGNKLFYRLNFRSHLVRSLFLLYSWNKVQDLSKNVGKALTSLVEHCLTQHVCSIYLFGSAVRSTEPHDIDVAIISNHRMDQLKKSWLQLMEDFEENIEVHFFPSQDFIRLWKEGDYTITSTLVSALVLYDRNFIFNYLGAIPAAGRKLLQSRISGIEQKLTRAFHLYREKKKESADIVEPLLQEILRLYIASQGEIPGSKHQLQEQAQRQGLVFKKKGLWETLEWMEQTLRSIKRNI